MAVDPMDRIERILIRCIEQDRRERRLRREQRKAGTLPERDKQIEEWLRQSKKKLKNGKTGSLRMMPKKLH